jgi:uncharacterized membrane protein
MLLEKKTRLLVRDYIWLYLVLLLWLLNPAIRYSQAAFLKVVSPPN